MRALSRRFGFLRRNTFGFQRQFAPLRFSRCFSNTSKSQDPPIDVEAQEIKSGDGIPATKTEPKRDIEDSEDFSQFDAKAPFQEKGTSTEEKGQSQKGERQVQSFKAETKQILDIVANSLYTDKEVFLRELISNASDALEKARYNSSLGREVVDPEKPLEIRIYSDDKNKRIIIQDYGIGMNREELISNIGTIAKSGSKEFLQKLKSEGGGSDVGTKIIGQFGVGFYSAFMVGEKVEIFSKSAFATTDSPPQYWTSDGSGSYEIGEAQNVTRGTKIIIHLKPNCAHFSNPHVIEGVIRKYSNFVGFPIFLNDEKVNTVQALWMMDKKDITEQQHTEFYKLLGGYDTPVYRLQFKVDTPLAINALFYFPSKQIERFETPLDPGVNLYSRKILIQSKSKNILPEWLRFVKGVVDSEDIPLNISRETMQDSALITKIKGILTKKIIKFLEEEHSKNYDKYMEWYLEFANFVKEGVIQDPNSPADIGRLLRFESSISTPTSTSPSYLVPSQATQPGKELSHGFKQYSFDEYISRMAPDQKGIYWLLAPNRDLALRSPYLEAFQKKNMEVLFLYNQGIDAWLMRNLQEYGKRKLINVEGADLAIPQKENKDIEPKAILELCDWMGQILKDRVESVKVSQRLATSPAVVVGHELAPLLKIYRSAMPNYTMAKPKLEINFEHPLIQKLNRARSAQPVLANLIVEQIYDNALLQADILENPRNMIPRLHNLLEKSLDQTLNSTPTSGSPSSSSSSPSDSPSSPSPASSS